MDGEIKDQLASSDIQIKKLKEDLSKKDSTIKELTMETMKTSSEGSKALSLL